MASRLEDTSAILGEYMLKGWTLTDLHCDECKATPLMREPAAIARNEGRAPIQFCALCDGGPEGRARTSDVHTPSEASVSSSSYVTPSSTPSVRDTYAYDPPSPTTPTAAFASEADAAPTPAAATGRPPTPDSPPANHAASARGDMDAAADAISDLLLRGYSLLQATCPEPACRGVPLVGYPRRKDGQRDPRRECVSCSQRWIDEKDLNNSRLTVKEPTPKPTPAPAPASVASSSTTAVASPTPSSSTVVAPPPVSTTAEAPESPRSKARRELYAEGNAIMEERARVAAAAEAEKLAAAERTRAAAEEQRNAARQAAAAPAQPPAAHGYNVPAQLHQAQPEQPLASAAGPSTSTPARRPFVAAEHRPDQPDGKLRVVVMTTGSVASIKLPNIVSSLLADGNVEVQVVATKSSVHFYDKAAVEAANPGVTVWTDEDEWSDWRKIGDPILHIELRRWADLVVIAPTSADILAKIAAGLCDNLALSFLRALDASTPVILCPAMNTAMYAHPMTARHLAFIRKVLHYHVLGPQAANKLACGDVGAGKMTEWTDIVKVILGYAAVFRNRPDIGDKLILDAFLVSDLALHDESDIEFDPLPGPQVQAPTSTGSHHHTRTRSRRHGAATAAARQLPPIDTITVQPPTPKKAVRPLKAATDHDNEFVEWVLSIPAFILRILLIPLLFMLHVLFTISSIVLRVVQAQPSPPVELTKPAPSHLALVMVPGKGPRKVIAERYVDSVRRAIQWAGEWGVTTISVWDGQGLGVQLNSAVTNSLLDLPPSPPSSAPVSPPETEADAEADESTTTAPLATLGDDTVSKSVYINSPSGPRRVDVHFLAPSAVDVISRVAKQYVDDDVTTTPSAITEPALDAAVKADLDLPTDPELLIIHHLSPPGFLRGLLPRPAPELWGYPAWALRITEIYTHPPTLPLYIPFIGALLHNSPLAIVRKVGAQFPAPEAAGVFGREAWEGAQAAWERVEQRSGK